MALTICVRIDTLFQLEDRGCNCNREKDLEELKRVDEMIVETNGKVEILAKKNKFQNKEKSEFSTL